MASDRVSGAVADLKGRAEGVLGDVTGDARLKVDGAVDQAKGVVQSAYGQAKDAVGQAKDAVSDYADQARDIAGRAAEEGQRYADRGRVYLQEGRRYVDDNLPDARRYYDQGRQAVSERVEQSPLAAILIAGAVGYMLALLVHGRR